MAGCVNVGFLSPQAMSFEAHSLTVPSVMWLGLLPSDLQRFGLNLHNFLLPSPASNWDCILGTFRVFVLDSVAVLLFYLFFCSSQSTAFRSVWCFKYTSTPANLGEKAF